MKRVLVITFMIFTSIIAYYFWPEKSLDTTLPIDKIVVTKHQRKLVVYHEDQPIKTYTISLGGEPVGKKEYEGDQKTPEGIYVIHDKNPHSGYHLNLGISYPYEKDIAHAKGLGKPPGGQIKIHGLPNGQGFMGKFQRWRDWTAGCIAVTNEEIEELYYNVDIGTIIEIKK